MTGPIAGTALGFLALLNPKPPVSLVPYLLPRLLDTKASPEKLLAICSVLLRAAPEDPAVIGGVLNLLQEHRDVQMRCEVIRMIGAAQSLNARTLAPFDSGLVDPDPNVRLMAVQAVERQRPDVIEGFAPQLRKMAADPVEQSPSRESASRALKRLNAQ
jgi:HEAT repeats